MSTSFSPHNKLTNTAPAPDTNIKKTALPAQSNELKNSNPPGSSDLKSSSSTATVSSALSTSIKAPRPYHFLRVDVSPPPLDSDKKRPVIPNKPAATQATSDMPRGTASWVETPQQIPRRLSSIRTPSMEGLADSIQQHSPVLPFYTFVDGRVFSKNSSGTIFTLYDPKENIVSIPEDEELALLQAELKQELAKKKNPN